eukprot:COSAG01_NODE_14812_length_1407_cov_0.662080_2_plen_89_part_00
MRTHFSTSLGWGGFLSPSILRSFGSLDSGLSVQQSFLSLPQSASSRGRASKRLLEASSSVSAAHSPSDAGSSVSRLPFCSNVHSASAR